MNFTWVMANAEEKEQFKPHYDRWLVEKSIVRIMENAWKLSGHTSIEVVHGTNSQLTAELLGEALVWYGTTVQNKVDVRLNCGSDSCGIQAVLRDARNANNLRLHILEPYQMLMLPEIRTPPTPDEVRSIPLTILYK